MELWAPRISPARSDSGALTGCGNSPHGSLGSGPSGANERPPPEGSGLQLGSSGSPSMSCQVRARAGARRP
eukprot:12121160-Alexandrium_andersonii.AAC.1